MLKTKLPLGFEPIAVTLNEEYKKVRYFFYDKDEKIESLNVKEEQIIPFMTNFIGSDHSLSSTLEKYSKKDQFGLKCNILAVLNIAYRSWALDKTELFGPKEYWEMDEFCCRMNKKFEQNS